MVTSIDKNFGKIIPIASGICRCVYFGEIKLFLYNNNNIFGLGSLFIPEIYPSFYNIEKSLEKYSNPLCTV